MGDEHERWRGALRALRLARSADEIELARGALRDAAEGLISALAREGRHEEVCEVKERLRGENARSTHRWLMARSRERERARLAGRRDTIVGWY